MPEVDLHAVKEYLKTHLAHFTEPAQVRFREIQKQVKSQFGYGMFMPQLSALIREINPALSKPPRKKAGKKKPAGKPGRKAGRKPGPKPGRKPGRPAGTRRGPGRPRGTGNTAGQFLIRVGRKLWFARSRDHVQSIIDKMVAAGQSLGRLRIFSLSPVRVSTRITLE